MYLTPSNGAVWKSWPDFSSWNREELVDSRPDAESLRTCHPVILRVRWEWKSENSTKSWQRCWGPSRTLTW